MIIPRHIIYDMAFFSSWFRSDDEADKTFRAAFAAQFGDHDIAVVPLGRARAGLYLLAKSAITPTRTKVILSPYTIPDVVNMVKFAGGEPVFVDFLPDSTNVDVDHLRSLVDEMTACVIVTHYHVCQAEMPTIAEICRESGAKLFDDCAIALGASRQGHPVGTLSDGSVFSFSGFKLMNFYWGGAIVVPKGVLADALAAEVETWPRLSFRSHLPQIKKVLVYALLTSRQVFPAAFRARRRVMGSGAIVDVLPLSRVETTQLDETITSRPSVAALAEWVQKMGEVPRLIAHRRGIAAIYDKHFRAINASAETPDGLRAESGFVNYPIVVGLDRRNDVYRAALQNGYDIGLSLYPDVQEMQSFETIPGRTTNVSNLVRSIVSLPTHPRVTREYAEELSAFILRRLTMR